MIIPVKRNIQIYKGADYDLSFRVQSGDEYLDLSTYTIRFRAADQPGGTRIWDFQTGTSPLYITVNADGYAVIAIPASVTGAVSFTDLYFEIDIIKDGVVSRVMAGSAQFIASA